MVRASRAGDHLGWAAGDHDVLGAVDGLFLNRSGGDGSHWSRSSAGCGLDLAIDDLANGLHSTHNGTGAKGSKSKRVLHFEGFEVSDVDF